MNESIGRDGKAAHWSVEEAAAYLGMAPCSVRTLISTRKLGHLRIGPNGGRIRIRPSDCEAYLESCQVVPKGPETLLPIRVVPQPRARPFAPEGPIERELARRAARAKQ